MTNIIGVKHNIEVAHRLFELPGKCENIHGHSMWVTMKIKGEVNSHGILGGIEYGDLKKIYRAHLDGTYDHRVLLNKADPFAGEFMLVDRDEQGRIIESSEGGLTLPGLQTCEGDPTTENIARWVLRDMQAIMNEIGMLDNVQGLSVEVWETSVNFASSAEENF